MQILASRLRPLCCLDRLQADAVGSLLHRVSDCGLAVASMLAYVDFWIDCVRLDPSQNSDPSAADAMKQRGGTMSTVTTVLPRTPVLLALQ